MMDRVVGLIRAILNGDVTLQALYKTWDDTFAGNVHFACSSGDELVVFNDCATFDYIDSVKFTDGSLADYDAIHPRTGDIDGFFTYEEYAAFEAILKAAPAINTRYLVARSTRWDAVPDDQRTAVESARTTMNASGYFDSLTLPRDQWELIESFFAHRPVRDTYSDGSHEDSIDNIVFRFSQEPREHFLFKGVPCFPDDALKAQEPPQ